MKYYTEETLIQAMEDAAHDGRSGTMPPYDLSCYDSGEIEELISDKVGDAKEEIRKMLREQDLEILAELI